MTIMGRSFDAGQFFNSPDFSDVTIRFSGREIKCHKLILCSNSDYFSKICGPNGKFVEREQAVIELKDDDPEAVEQVLRYVYFGQYDREGARASDWAYHLEVSKAASKYLFPQLEQAAFEAFQAIVDGLTDAQKIWAAVTGIRAAGSDNDVDSAKSLAVADALERRHLLALMRDPRFRADIDADKALLWRYIDQLADFAAGFGAQSLTAGLQEVQVFWCVGCDAYGVCAKHHAGAGAGAAEQPLCGRRYCRAANVTSVPCWVPQEHASAVLLKVRPMNG